MAHQAKIITPLGDEALQLRQFSGLEGLSQLFTYDLTLYSTDEEIKPDQLLGQNVTIQLVTGEDFYRNFNGFVSQFAYLNQSEEGQAVYQATVSPWLWFLTRTSDCKIYQDMTVVEIVKSVFSENGFSSDFKEELIGSYRKWEYCVQYRETDFNFISRLLEQEGIYYYFEHEEDSHKLVLVDDLSSHKNIAGNPQLPFHQPSADQTVDTEHVSEWQLQCGVQPDRVMLGDYNFKTPRKSLRVEKAITRSHAKKGQQIFDYPGEYTTDGEGEHYSLARLEEISTNYEQVNGTTDARNLATGGLFSLVGHPRKDQDREYLVLSAQYDISVGLYTSGGSDDDQVFLCAFSALDSKTQFRPPRVTPKPVVQGPQTAFVVGKSGEEIDPDEYGRIKVQFHWDRQGKSDELSSCWMRVGQIWAGGGWGAQFIPRIGHEVIVNFLEGDPDRPLVTGSVYNAANMPPYELPANKTQSGIKSRSTLKGTASNFNELRMEDKKGEEELYIQAEKDENILVKNCKTETVGVDETISIGNNREETVGNDESITVGNNRVESVGNNETLSVGVNRTRNVGSNENITVAQNRLHNVGVNEAINVGANQAVNVGAIQNFVVGKNQSASVGKNRSADVGDNDSLKVGKNLVIDAGDSITIKTGKASITMKKDGTIQISGKDISVIGKGGINVKASKNIVMKGKKILQN